MAVTYQNLESDVSWPGTLPGSVSNNERDLTIDAAGEKVGYQLYAPQAGTVDQIIFHTGTVTQDPVNGLKISIQGVTAATGLPDGVISHYRTQTTFASESSFASGLITDDGTDTGNKKTLTAGELFAVVIEFDTFVAGDKLEIRDRQANYLSCGQRGSVHSYVAAAWVAQNVAYPNILLKYDDGSFVPFSKAIGVGSCKASSQQKQFDVNTTPDEVGNKFTAPYNCKLSGVSGYMGARGDTWNVVVYDSSDNVLATLTYGTDIVVIHSTNTNYNYRWVFPAPIELTADEVYRVTVKSTSDAGAGTRFYFYIFADTDYADALEVDYERTERTDGGAWTDTELNRMCMSLYLSDIEAGGDGPKLFDC